MNLRTAAGGLLQRVQLVIRRVNSAQTANLLEAQDQAGAILARIDKDGKVYSVGGGAAGQALVGGDTAGGDLSGTYPSPAVAKASAAFQFTADISPASIGANQDDYAPAGHATTAVFRLTSSGNYNITGLAGGVDGRIVFIYNIGAFALTLKDETTSTAANRFALTGDVVLAPDDGVILQYDSTTLRWRLVGKSIGGGGTLTVKEVDGAPSVNPVTTIVVPNGSLTDDTGGQVTIALSATDANAIHVGTAAEISGITEKLSPIGADLIVIEDSAAGNAKKRVQIANLPAGGGTVATDAVWDTKGDLVAATGPNAAVKLPAGTIGQVLTPDTGESMGLKWLATDRGALELLKRRASANTEDDHFDATSLDAKWLAYTNANLTANLSTCPGWLIATANGFKLQAVPAGDWTIETEVIPGDVASAAYGNAGLILTNGTTATAATDARFGIGMNNSLTNFRLVFEKFVNNAFSAGYGTNWIFGVPLDHLFLRYIKSGTNYYVEWSTTGITWNRWNNTAALGFTPTHFGLGTSGPTNSMFNYFLRY